MGMISILFPSAAELFFHGQDRIFRMPYIFKITARHMAQAIIKHQHQIGVGGIDIAGLDLPESVKTDKAKKDDGRQDEGVGFLLPHR